jgi:HK97 family phage major capsid protein
MTMQNIRGSLRGSSALRGIVRVGAETDPVAEVRALIQDITRKVEANQAETKKTFEDFKAANDAKTKDVVSAEKVDRINAALDEQGKELDKLNAQLAALKIGGNNPAGGETRASTTAEQKAYRAAFSGKDGYLRRGADANLSELAVKASLSSDSSPDGGYTVTPELDTAISRVQMAVSAMRRISQVVTISTATYRKLVSQGGAGSGWVGEDDSRPQTNTPTLSGLDFPSKELYAMPAATQTLLDDSAVNIEEWLANEVAITFAEQEGASFVTGDGVSKPFGFLSYAAVADTSYAWGKLGYYGTGGTGLAADPNGGDVFLSMIYGLKQSYRQNGQFIMNRKTQAAVRKLKDSYGHYIWQPTASAGQPATLFGYPIADDDNMPDLASNALAAAFGDFMRGYLIVDRIGVRVLRDPFSAKPYVLFYTTKRVGGGVQNFEAIKLLKCA